MFSFVMAPRNERLHRVWLVGCGAMGGTLLGRWVDAGLPAASVTVIDPAPVGLPPRHAGAVVADAAAAAAISPEPTLVVLGIKPQMLPGVAAGLAPFVAHRPLLLSMLAGVRTGTLAQLFPGAPIIRIMPNLPARIGRGTTSLFAAGAGAEDAAAAEWLMAAAGSLLWLDDEGRFDAVTAVSGSGPAFLFRFIEALAGAAEAAGLEPQVAQRLALETVAGAAELAAQSGVSPAVLRQQVTSPNGTTQAGLDVLDGDGLLSSLLRGTVRAAAERSRALAAQADSAADPALVREASRTA
jgi:pyrroline-5-carboxylate reductase